MSVEINSTNFPDPVWQNLIRRYDKDHDGILSDSEIEDITWIICNDADSGYSDLVSIAGSEYFTNVRNVDLDGLPNLEDISAISGLSNIRYVRIQSCPKITTIDLTGSVNTLNQIYYWMDNGSPSNINIIGLSQCRSIRYINLFNKLSNEIEDQKKSSINNGIALDFSGLTTLETFGCEGFTNRTIDLSRCYSLLGLSFENSNVTHALFDESLALERLSIENTKLTDKDVDLSKHTKLNSFYAEYCPNLTSIDISNVPTLLKVYTEATPIWIGTSQVYYNLDNVGYIHVDQSLIINGNNASLKIQKVIESKIYIGSLNEPIYLFENDSIMSLSTTQAVALIGQELSIDTLTATVLTGYDDSHNIYIYRSSDGEMIECGDGSIFALHISESKSPSGLITIQEWTPIWYYQDDILVGKFYIESVKRIAKKQYQLNCVSAIGRLDRMYHGGGLFEVSTFGAVLAHILASGLHGDGAPVIDYYIDDDVAELTVSGWLPYDTKRNNLYQLIFSHGVNIIKNADGSPRFTFVYTDSRSTVPIADSDIFQTGNVEYEKPYSSVSIMEHTYSDLSTGVNPTVLYDNTTATRIENEEIWFDQAPIIVSTLQATEGLTIVSSTVNSAILTGNGKLTGIPYTHTTRTVSRANSTGDREKTVSVERCTMVNVLNSENLLNRLYAFYCPTDFIKKISNELVYKDERCGKQYQFSNPYMEQEDALLSKMDLNTTTFNRARCEFYAGYEPVGQQGLYQNCIILDKATFAEDGGTWTVPQEILEMDDPQIRVVMIGGGKGGYGGLPGEDGQDGMTYTYAREDEDVSAVWYGAEGGAGGAGGNGGTAGRVKAITIQNPASSYDYTIGDGGDGGAAQTAGNDGTASTFDTYSSDDQDSYIPVAGYYNPILGEFYALGGFTGLSGGQGGARKIGTDGNFAWSTDGEDVIFGDSAVYHGGKTGTPLTSIDGLPECKMTAYGGNGAGAAVGVDRADYPDMDGQSDQEASWEVVEDGV